MNRPQGTARPERATVPAADLSVGGLILNRISREVANYAVERLEIEIDAPMAEDYFDVVAGALAEKIDPILSALLLPPITFGQIGGTVEVVV
jgi:hypothetical protein